MRNINIYAFADEASPFIDEQIKSMKLNNVSGIEIRNVDNINISDITVEKAKEVKKKLDDAGLITWSIGSPIGKIDIVKDDFEQHKEKFKHTLEISSILGAQNIRLFSFFIPKEENPECYTNEVIDRLGQFVSIASNYSIDLCHENEKGIYGALAPQCLAILKALPQIKGIFDPANFVQCGQDTLDAWKILKPYIKYMHIKDAMNDGYVVPAGMGDGNVRQIVADFIDNGGCNFTIEPHLTVFSGLSSLERESEKSNVGKITYDNSEKAFEAAINAFKGIIREL